MNNIYDNKKLQVPRNASQVPCSTGTADSAVSSDTKLNCHGRWENTGDSARPNVGNHTVFVLDEDGKPLTPTTPAKARKLLRGGKAKKAWSKFNTFGIQLTEPTRKETPETTIGYDAGTKFEGISVVCGTENSLSVKLNLPNKNTIRKRMKNRKMLRAARRRRKTRRRAHKFKRSHKSFIAPAQKVIVCSRLKILKEFCKIFPVNNAAIEDVRFNHYKYDFGKNFSTVEVGKSIIREFFKNKNIEIFEYRGFETAELRKKYGYKKTKVKSADKFSAHCSDSLTLAADVNCGDRVKEGKFLVVDDRYRPMKRMLHRMQPEKGGKRPNRSRGTVKSLGKGILVCSEKGHVGQLCGETKGFYRFKDLNGGRKLVKNLSWVNNQFKTVI